MIACAMLMVPIFVPVALVTAGAVGLADVGLDAAALGAAGNAAAVPPFWAAALTERANAVAITIRANLLVMCCFGLLGNFRENVSDLLQANAGHATRSTRLFDRISSGCLDFLTTSRRPYWCGDHT